MSTGWPSTTPTRYVSPPRKRGGAKVSEASVKELADQLAPPELDAVTRLPPTVHNMSPEFMMAANERVAHARHVAEQDARKRNEEAATHASRGVANVDMLAEDCMLQLAIDEHRALSQQADAERTHTVRAMRRVTEKQRALTRPPTQSRPKPAATPAQDGGVPDDAAMQMLQMRRLFGAGQAKTMTLLQREQLTMLTDATIAETRR